MEVIVWGYYRSSLMWSDRHSQAQLDIYGALNSMKKAVLSCRKHSSKTLPASTGCHLINEVNSLSQIPSLCREVNKDVSHDVHSALCLKPRPSHDWMFRHALQTSLSETRQRISQTKTILFITQFPFQGICTSIFYMEVSELGQRMEISLLG